MLKISECSENCKKACWNFQNVLKTVMHVVCLKFQRIKTMLNISGCVENMLKISRHVENYNMCRKLCWNIMLKISHVLNTVTLAESHVKTSRRVENVYVRHVENHIENHVEVRKKDHHTLRHVSKLSGRFRFSPSVCMSYWSETYVSLCLRMQNAVSPQPCVGKLGKSPLLLNFLVSTLRIIIENYLIFRFMPLLFFRNH